MITFSIIQKSQLENVNRIDSQYFRPEYLVYEEKLNRTRTFRKWGDLEGKFITGPFGSEFDTSNYISAGQYRYVRGKDVRPFKLLDNDNVYIPEKDFHNLNKYSLEVGDILISVVGTLGYTAVVDEKTLPAIFSCKSTVFRSQEIDPLYLTAYLNCKYGYGLLIRNERGANQTGLNIGDLKNLPIYIPPKSSQQMVADLLQESRKSEENSDRYYWEANVLLLEELGLKDFQEENNSSNIVNFADIQDVRRIDAEYFQTKYERLVEKVKLGNAKSLGELVSIKKGFEPGSEAYQEKGKLFIRVSSLSKFGVNSSDQKYLSHDLYEKLKKDFQPQTGEILLTKDATPGTACVLREKAEGIISGGILRLKIKSEIEPEYLALCINSIVGKWQAERDAGGSIISHWKLEQIKELLIPVLPTEKQQEIAELVKKSHEARKKSKQLLEEAKRRVEEMIEKGGDN